MPYQRQARSHFGKNMRDAREHRAGSASFSDGPAHAKTPQSSSSSIGTWTAVRQTASYALHTCGSSASYGTVCIRCAMQTFWDACRRGKCVCAGRGSQKQGVHDALRHTPLPSAGARPRRRGAAQWRADCRLTLLQVADIDPHLSRHCGDLLRVAAMDPAHVGVQLQAGVVQDV